MKLEAVSNQRSQAFTLLETMCAMAILATVIVALYAGISSGFSVVESSREELRATQIMVEKLETIRLYNWDQINDPNFIPREFTDYYDYRNQAGFTYNGTILIEQTGWTDTYAANMRKITISISWTSPKRLHERSMFTYVTKNGLQSYVF